MDPDEITNALGVPPDALQRRGELIPTKGPSGSRIAKFGMWRLHAVEAVPGALNRQVAELLARLNPDVTVWAALTRKHKADLFCGWFMAESNEGEDISPHTLSELGRRGVALSLDIYAPEPDA
ncbi:DUF4279 domain-containing protein [Methylibium sp. Pch-M]|uniref:DUF4279 domain-containing protein n=1 Tax=Methylibium sp. Pch-M TaxID=2082386 RepID=UPI0038F6FE15